MNTYQAFEKFLTCTAIVGGVACTAFVLCWTLRRELRAALDRWLALGPAGRCATALFSGLVAKETVVSTLEVLLGGASPETLFSTKSALAFLTFTLLYTPCVAAISTIAAELRSWLRAGLVVLWQCGVAWIMAFVVFRLLQLV